MDTHALSAGALVVVLFAAPACTRVPAPPVVASPALDGPTYAVRLHDLEARVDELREHIRRSQARPCPACSHDGPAIHATIRLQSRVPHALDRIVVVLDGGVQLNRTGEAIDASDLAVFSGSVPAGGHEISVLALLRGTDGSRFELHASHTFSTTPDRDVEVTVSIVERGVREGPAIEIQETMVPRNEATTDL